MFLHVHSIHYLFLGGVLARVFGCSVSTPIHMSASHAIANSTTTWQTTFFSFAMFSGGQVDAINLLKYCVWFCCFRQFMIIHGWKLEVLAVTSNHSSKFQSFRVLEDSSPLLHFSRNGNWAWKRISHCQHRPRMSRPTSLMKSMVLWQHGKFLFWLLLCFLTTKLLKMFVFCGWVL